MSDLENMEVSLDTEITEENDAAKWYVIHTYSGHENKVKDNIIKAVANKGLQDRVFQVVVPTKTEVVMDSEGRPKKDKNGKIRTKEVKIFPCYVIVKMIDDNETWFLVRNTQGVTGFLGTGTRPSPLTKQEISRMGLEKVSNLDIDVNIGDEVRITSGPFEGQAGRVEEINPDKQMLRVILTMFGRDTPVELDFGQVIKK
ncbi:MAG: transcription termination/antitermination protein NusG [Clostridia bacterium]|nr:transcription termination/antitermination protein NusG [Clostridia bacterium]